MVMPVLARNFEVIAVDQRGMGLSDKPAGGYDTGTLAGDLVALMDALGHERFALIGHDTGFAVSYALAADHPERVERAALLEDPRSSGPSPSAIGDARRVSRSGSVRNRRPPGRLGSTLRATKSALSA
jgi:pimeloyl-ACP methyl ester carboxylesterase